MKSYVFHPEAEAEFMAALGRYATISEGLGRRFYAEMHGLLAEVSEARSGIRLFGDRCDGTSERCSPTR